MEYKHGMININYSTRAPSYPLGHYHFTHSPSLAMAFLQNCSPGKEPLPQPATKQQKTKYN